ncbi:MAG: hypothetical protein QW472_02220 [Candidatus Aenigmatarchaeota archaeon]
MFIRGDRIVNEKLQSIFQKLNVSDQDIRNIQNIATKEKLVRFLIHPILIVILSVLTFMLGISSGDGCTNCAGYPFPGIVEPALIPERGKKSAIYRLFIPVVTFILGYLVGRTFFGYVRMYNVYKK